MLPSHPPRTSCLTADSYEWLSSAYKYKGQQSIEVDLTIDVTGLLDRTRRAGGAPQALDDYMDIKGEPPTVVLCCLLCCVRARGCVWGMVARMREIERETGRDRGARGDGRAHITYLTCTSESPSTGEPHMVGAIGIPADRMWTAYGMERAKTPTLAMGYMVYGIPKSSTDELSR